LDFVNGGGREGVRKSLKGLMVEVKVRFLACFSFVFIKIVLKMIREQSERRKNKEKVAFWA